MTILAYRSAIAIMISGTFYFSYQWSGCLL